METDKIGLSDLGRKLLMGLRVARDPEDLVEAGISPRLLEAMLMEGLLEPQDETAAPVELQDTFGALKSHRGMLVDSTRTLAFQKAISEVVKPGDKVIDVGAGSGVLSMFAAQAGAHEVMALELTQMADWAARVAQYNGLNNVHVLRGDAGAFVAQDPVDVVMGEFIGLTLLDEWRHFAAFANVRDRNLRPDGKVIPRAARLMFSAVDSRKLYVERGYGFWEAPAYGIDFSEFRAPDIASPARYIVTADENDLVSTRQVASFDFQTGSRKDCFFASETVFHYPAAGNFHGILAHFELDMAPGQVLSTSPANHETCWHHSYLPLPMIQVPAGGEVRLHTESFLDPESDTMCLGLTVAGPGEALTEDLPQHIFPLE